MIQGLELGLSCIIIVLVQNFTNFVRFESKISISVLYERDEKTDTYNWLREMMEINYLRMPSVSDIIERRWWM